MLSAAPALAVANDVYVQFELKVASRAGIEIIYSTDLVPADLTAPQPRPDATPLQRSLEVLAPNGLTLRAIGGGRYVVVKASEPRVVNATPQLPNVLDEVTVYASRYSMDVGRKSETKSLAAADIQNIPGTHDDPMRALRALPGLAASASARPYIRGSLADDALVRYDDVTILDPFHLKNFQSLFGAIDPLAVSSMEVYSGGYPVRFGTRSGGVIDIVPRSIERGEEFDLTLSQTAVGVATLGAGDHWPIEWLATVRHNTTALLLEPIEAQDAAPRVLDAMGRLRWVMNERTDWTLGWLLLDDRVEFGDDEPEETARARYRDEYVWLTLGYRPAGYWRSRTTLALSAAERRRRGSVQRPAVSIGRLTESRSYNKVELTSEWTYEPDSSFAATLGAALATTSAEYSYSRELTLDPSIAASFGRQTTNNLAGNGEPSARAMAAYGSLRREWPRFEGELGVRVDGQDFNGVSAHAQWSPRLNVRYDLSERWHAYGSIGRFTQAQAVEEWRAEELQERPDPAQSAIHTVIGLSHESDAGMRWSLELYKKRWTRVSPYFESRLDQTSLLPDLHPDRYRIAPDVSEASGVEFSVRTLLKNGLHGWASLTASRVQDEFAESEQVRSWDQPLALNGGLAWTWNRLSFSAALGWHSGWPRTPVTTTGATSSSTVTLGARNSARWNDYLTLDLKGSWTRPSPNGEFALFAELTNSTGRHNLCCSLLRSADTTPGDLFVQRKHWLPLVVNLGVTYRWRREP